MGGYAAASVQEPCMFDIGWTELLVIAVVLIVVVGPKDLPPMLRAFRAQFDEALREADLDDVRQTISDAQKLNPVNSLREAMNPLRQMGNDIKADLQKASTAGNKTDVPPADISAPVPSMSLPETPPVVAPPPPESLAAAAVPAAVVAEKPKAVRKPRVKIAESADAVIAAPVEKPKRAVAAKAPTAAKPATPVAKKTAAAPKKTATKKKDEA
jgi:sec-independent protein translocase protein TatB